MSVLAFRLLGCRGRRRGGGLVDCRDLIGDEFLNLVDGCDGERCPVFLLGERSAPLEFLAIDLDYRAHRLRLGTCDRFGILDLELNLPDQPFGVESTPFKQIGLIEGFLPFIWQRHEPPFQGFSGVGAISRTWGRHRRN